MTGGDDETPRWPGPPESEEEEAEIERCARLIVGDGSRPEIEGERQRRARWREMIRQRLRRPAPAYWKRSWSRFQAWIDPELQPDAAQVELAFWRRLAEQQPDNPLFFWHARRLARGAGLPSPEWVEQYFDRTTSAIFREVEGRIAPGPSVDWLPATLGFTGKGGGAAERQFTKERLHLRIWSAGQRVKWAIGEGVCPWCATALSPPAPGKACSHCHGTGLWRNCDPESTDTVVGKLFPKSNGEPREPETIRKIRTAVKTLMTAPL